MAKEHLQSSGVVSHGLESTYSISDLRDQFIRYGYEVIEHSKDTMKTRESHLKYFVEYCVRMGVKDVRNLNGVIVDEFFVEYSNTPSKLTGRPRNKSTVNTARRILKVFIRWVDGYKETPLRVNPDAIRLVRTRSKLPQAIDDEIISRVIQGCDEEQDALMIACFREGGLRIGELVELKVEDVIDGQLRISKSKDYEDRLVNVTDRLAQRLKLFAQENKRDLGDWLFQNVYNGYEPKMTIGTARKRVQKCFLEIAGIHMKPKQLRDSMALGLLKQGCDLVTIQTQLGHKDIQTTMVYLRIENSYFKESYARSMTKSFMPY